jgi:hypothetical protein
MHLAMDRILREEIGRFGLAFTCEDCNHYVNEDEACDLLYDPTPHRNATMDALADGAPMAFCKMFEAA